MFLYSYIPFMIMVFSTVLIVKRLLAITSQLQKNSKKGSLTGKATSNTLERQFNLSKSDNTQNLTDIQMSLMDQSNNKQTQVNFKPDKNSLLEKRLRSYNQIYRLLLALNMMFLVLVSPLVLCNYFRLLGVKEIREMVYLLAYLNHCLNSFIYGMSCETYRNILFGIFNREQHRSLASKPSNV